MTTAKQKSKLASFKLIYWKWTPNKTGKCPVKLHVEYGGIRKRYPVIYEGEKLFVRESEWSLEAQNLSGRGDEKRKIKDTINLLKGQVKTAIDKASAGNQPFTWKKFEDAFLLNDESGKGFLSLFADHLERIRQEGRIGTYKAYNNALQAFKSFRKKKELSAFDITPNLLKDFEAYLVKRGNGRTTIGMYTRSIKVVYNLAADENPALLECYPFSRKQNDRKRYKIKTGSGHKGDALTIEQLREFIGAETTKETPEHEAKLLWLFSFHCQGMNMKDVSLLKYKDIQGATIHYVRAKTKDTEEKEAIIKIPVTDPIRNIISEIGNPDKRPGSYVFTIIPNGLASTVKRRTDKDLTEEERIADIIHQKVKMVNKRIQAICERDEVKLPKLTTYWARHTFANLQRESGADLEEIRELLGHSDVRVTENYVKRFDEDRIRKAHDRINDLLKVS